jgi:hypothetical protein
MQRTVAGSGLSRPVPSRAMQPFRAVRLDVSAAATEERLRLHNLSPQKGSRRDNKRKGRGYGAGQVWKDASDGMGAIKEPGSSWMQQTCHSTATAAATAVVAAPPSGWISCSCNSLGRHGITQWNKSAQHTEHVQQLQCSSGSCRFALAGVPQQPMTLVYTYTTLLQ